MTALAVRSLAIAVALAAGIALFAETRHYGLIGFDTHPLIASSRVEAPADLGSVVVAPLMDGRYPSGFHRPLTSLSFSLDEALWGLDPVGYQLTGVVLFTSLLFALIGLGAAIGGERARWLALALPLCFALHPSYYEIVPIPARRADLLCAVFATIAVTLAIRAHVLAAGVLSLLAILSKESGYAVPVLIAVAAAVFAPAGDLASRARAVRRAATPAFALAAVAFAGRLLVLGGIGGHRDDPGLLAAVQAAPGITFELLQGIALFGAASTPLAWATFALGLGLACAGLVLARGDAARSCDPIEGRAIVFGALWLGAFALLYATSGWVGAWYLMLPTVGAAITLVAAIGWLVRLALASDRTAQSRAVCASAALLLLGVATWQASFAPFFQRYGEWQRATETADDFLRELAGRIEASTPGRRVDAPPIPMWAYPREGVPGVFGAAILSDYSVQAWADLSYPERRIRVLGRPDGVLAPGPAEAGPNELVIVLERRLVGY